MSELGCYVTNEYGILKLIFSHLSSTDLIVASKVCKEWEDVAKRVQMENNKMLIYNKNKNNEWEPFNNKVQPRIILHFSANLKSNARREFIQLISESYSYVRPIYSIMNPWFITSRILKDRVKVTNERDVDSESLLILPEMSGVEIKTFSLTSRDEKFISKTHCKDVISGAKCCLLIVRATRANIQEIHNFVTSLENPETLILAGGLAAKLAKYSNSTVPNVSGKTNENHNILGITFGGDGVTAHSDIHDSSSDIHAFMKEFSETVGPQPKGAVRIAFMFVCVNRSGWFDQEETDIFSKYFPGVPVFGFWSLGEYCIKNPVTVSDTVHRRKRLKSMEYGAKGSTSVNLKFSHEECTTYLVITFKKPE